MNYESKITTFPNGEVTIATGMRSIRSENKPKLELLFEQETHYPSVETLRKSLVRQKFHAEVAKRGMFYTALGGYASAAAVEIFRDMLHIFPESLLSSSIKIGGIVIGITATTLEPKFRRRFDKYSNNVNSRVKAFNETFPELKPVVFSPRAYLSTIRIPFLH